MIQTHTTASRRAWPVSCIVALAVAACSPTVKLEAPDKPIVINMNIKVEQEVRVRLEKDIDQATSSRPGVF